MSLLNVSVNPLTSGLNVTTANKPIILSQADQTLIIINIFIGAIGLIGNAFVIIIIVCFTSMYKQLANLFVINQSIIDAFSSLLILITQALAIFGVRPVLAPHEFASELYCRVWRARLILWGTYTASIYNLVMLTLERYLKIVYPILHKTSFSPSKAKILLLSVWLFGFAFEISYSIPTSQVIGSSCMPVSIWPTMLTQQAIGILILCVQYFFPLIIFIVCYTKMIRIFARVKVQNGLGMIDVHFILVCYNYIFWCKK